MKRLLYVLTPLLVIGLFLLLGNGIVARTLDAQLPALLTRVLGLPVTIAPINARLMSLTATSDRLVMGDPQDPAVEATGVKVSLSWSALLETEIRFTFARADDLTVNPSRWPRSGGPPNENYQFLEQWLPDALELDRGRYVTESGFTYPIRAGQWARDGVGQASAQWREDQGGGEMAVTIELASLDDLLFLRPIALELAAQIVDDDSSRLEASVQIAPDQDDAYQLNAEVRGGGMQAQISAGNDGPWELPGYSTTTLDTFLPDVVMQLIAAYTEPRGEQPMLNWLDSTLPRLKLPYHQGQVAVDEIRLGNELGLDTEFDFTATEAGIYINGLESHGPRGAVSGILDIQSGDSGWSVEATATIKAKEDDESIGSQFIESHWLWTGGQADLSGAGATWGELLYSLAGQVRLDGHYRGEEETPVIIAGKLDSEPGEFSVDSLDIALGEVVLTGSASLSGEGRRLLKLNLVGEHMNLGFLFDGEKEDELEGIPLPEYLGLFPGVDVQVELDLSDLRTPAVALQRTNASLRRDEQGGTLTAKLVGFGGGELDLTLDANTPPGEIGRFTLETSIDSVDLPTMFRQDGLFFSRSSGTLSFKSTGDGMQDIFTRMRGSAELSIAFRADNDWTRPPNEGENIEFSGDAQLVLTGDRITGLEIDNLDIDSLDQDLTGSISIVDGREPWMIADLQSESLNTTKLFQLLPKSSEEADQRDVLRDLRDLGSIELSLYAGTMVIGDFPLQNLSTTLYSAQNEIEVKKLDFGAQGSSVQSNAKINWQGDRAALESYASVSQVNIDQFLVPNAQNEFVPVSGSLKLESEGRNVGELMANVNGYIDLAATDASQDGDPRKRRKLAMRATRLPDGVEAQVSSLQFGESELSGRLRYKRGTPAHYDIELSGGTLSLLTWEKQEEQKKAEKARQAKKDESPLADTARSSARLVGNVLRAPLRMFSSDEDEPSERLFSDEPLPLDWLENMSMNIDGRLDRVDSSVISAKDLQFAGKAANGRLDVDMSSARMNGGRGKLDLMLDAADSPTALEVDMDFREIRGLTGGETYPRSGFMTIRTTGNSTAELAAAADGVAYLELGKGPFDYANSAILTADIASSVFRNLVPGIETQEPTLECGVAALVFQKGVGLTPYGYALRTNSANIIGRIELDLRKETMQLNFDSRGREGVGISVGSVFSNTVQVRGSLTDPSIVPNTTGIIWRGWAAFMTAGLSIVGESVIKRALASDNPCRSIKRLITEDLCPKSPRAAKSDLVCPVNS